MQMSPIPIIDVFAGPGGLGEGFCAFKNRGSYPFRIALSIEKDVFAWQTLSLSSFFRQFRYLNLNTPQAYYQHVQDPVGFNRDQLFNLYPMQARQVSDETWNALDIIEQRGGPTWFRLGDADIGLHLERSRRLMEGDPLSRICKDVCDSLGITVQILPMSDDRVPTWVSTAEGELPFQEYFVLRQCQPEVTGFRFENAGMAHPSPGVMEAIGEADLVVICPSNPWVSVDPILSIPGVREAVAGRMTVAVSPIIGGRALKGPAAKMYAELGIDPSAVSVARHYNGLIDRIVIDNLDVGLAGEIEALGIQPLVTDTVMKTRPDRRRLAKKILETGGMAARSPGDE